MRKDDPEATSTLQIANGSSAPHIGREHLRCHFLKADMAAMTLAVVIAPKAVSH